MTDLTALLSKARELEAAATPGQWEAQEPAFCPNFGKAKIHPLKIEGKIGGFALLKQCDAEFIAAFRALAKPLLAVAEASISARESFLPRLEHGDANHRQWLRDEVAFIFAPLDRALSALSEVKL